MDDQPGSSLLEGKENIRRRYLLDPDLPHSKNAKDGFPGDLDMLSIATIRIKSVLSDLDFFCIQERASRLVNFVGEIYNEPVSKWSQCDGD